MSKFRIIILLITVFTLLNSCGKDRRYTKHLDGVWRLTKMVKNGEEVNVSKLKIELETTLSYPNIGETFANYYEKETLADNTVNEENYDVQITISNKGKTMTFDYEYGTLSEFIEVYDIIDFSRNKFEIKFVGEENYYTFEKLKL